MAITLILTYIINYNLEVSWTQSHFIQGITQLVVDLTFRQNNYFKLYDVYIEGISLWVMNYVVSMGRGGGLSRTRLPSFAL